jgi:ribose transport system permease protein
MTTVAKTTNGAGGRRRVPRVGRVRQEPRGRDPREFIGRFGVLIAFALTVAVFGALRPDTFLTIDNARIIAIQAAPLAIIALGLTVVLVMNDFDLSFGAVAGLVGAAAISLMAVSDVFWIWAILMALGLAALIGVANGVFVAYAGAPSFIVTLAMSTAAIGVEFLITDRESIFTGIASEYIQIAQGSVLGINAQVVLAAVVLASVLVLLDHSELGRRMYAVGGNPEAARLAGIRIARLRLVGFVIAAVLAGVAGVLISAENSAYTPTAADGFLLPAFAAVFLGSTVLRGGTFNALGTAIGVVYLGVIQNGLILLGIATAWVNIVQGGILIGAVLLARIGAR